MESWGLCLWREGGSVGSPVAETSGSLASCSNAVRTLRRSLLGMEGSIALMVRVDLAS